MNESRPVPPQGPLPVRPAIVPAHAPHQATHAPAGMPKVSGLRDLKVPDNNLDPISLEDEPADATPQPSKIRAFGVKAMGNSAHDYKRIPTVTGTGAVRVRTFHGRLSDEGMAFMDEKINEWMDNHPDIEVKQVTTTIGLFEGKIKEQALVVNIWY
jgi:hypothetical protein